MPKYCFFFFFGSVLMGEKKTHKQNSPEIPGQSREMFVYVFFFFMCFFFAPNSMLFKLSAYKMGVSMRLFMLQALSLFKLHFSIVGENRSLNEQFKSNIWA